MLILLNRKSIKKTIVAAFTFITTVSLMFFIFPQILQPIYSKVLFGFESTAFDFNFYSPLSRAWQFTLGGLCFFALDHHRNRIYNFKKLPNLLFISVLIIILYGNFHLDTRYGSIIASLIASMVIVLRSLDSLPIFVSSILEWIGDRSYSIYLLHMPLIYIAKYALATSLGEGQNRTIQTVVAVVATLILGSLSYSKIENRFREQGKKEKLSTKNMSFTFLLTFLLPLWALNVRNSWRSPKHLISDQQSKNGTSIGWIKNISKAPLTKGSPTRLSSLHPMLQEFSTWDIV
jgi:peptidoglycan/LPS O-acetylase OafA/YrhL